MSHKQMFLEYDNEEGYISVIVHRERYGEALISLGFVNSPDEFDINKDIPEDIPEAENIPEDIPEAENIPEDIPEAENIPEDIPKDKRKGKGKK